MPPRVYDDESRLQHLSLALAKIILYKFFGEPFLSEQLKPWWDSNNNYATTSGSKLSTNVGSFAARACCGVVVTIPEVWLIIQALLSTKRRQFCRQRLSWSYCFYHTGLELLADHSATKEYQRNAVLLPEVVGSCCY